MKKLFLFIFIVGLIFTGLYFWWESGISPVDSSDKNEKIFIIQGGEGTREIADNLKKGGLIRDPLFFLLLIKIMGIDGKIQAGQFSLNPSMSSSEIVQALQLGTFDITIIIPEGKRSAEIAEILKYNFSTYNDSWNAKLESEEGYLFPDTYYYSKDADIDLIISKMKDNFNKKFSEIQGNINNSLSKEEIVIIASLVEREAKYDSDRPLVASVIINRYNIGMKLDIDATVQYALGYQPASNSWWKKSLTHDDLEFDSSYNTYINPGLPPGPISNPGLKALSAVASAPDTDYLFYVSDKEGYNHYASTLKEHNQNIEKYRD